jgi:hypothetical protein
MLAEIFMVRLEAAARVEAIPASNSRFVPFYQAGVSGRTRTKDEAMSLADPVGVYSPSNRG